MRISMSVAVKCAIPPIRNHRNTAVRPIRFNIRNAEAFAGCEISCSLFIFVHRCAKHPPGNNPDPSSAGARGAGGAKALQPRRQPHPFRGAATSGFCGSSPSTENTNARGFFGSVHHRRAATSRHTALTAVMALARPVCKAVSMRVSAWVHAATSGASSGIDCMNHSAPEHLRRLNRTRESASAVARQSASPDRARPRSSDNRICSAAKEHPAAGCRRGRPICCACHRADCAPAPPPWWLRDLRQNQAAASWRCPLNSTNLTAAGAD